MNSNQPCSANACTSVDFCFIVEDKIYCLIKQTLTYTFSFIALCFFKRSISELKGSCGFWQAKINVLLLMFVSAEYRNVLGLVFMTFKRH